MIKPTAAYCPIAHARIIRQRERAERVERVCRAAYVIVGAVVPFALFYFATN